MCDSALASGPAGSPERWSISPPATWTHAPPGCPRPSCGSRPGICILRKYCSTDHFRPSQPQLKSGNVCVNVMCMCLTQYCCYFFFSFQDICWGHLPQRWWDSEPADQWEAPYLPVAQTAGAAGCGWSRGTQRHEQRTDEKRCKVNWKKCNVCHKNSYIL